MSAVVLTAGDLRLELRPEVGGSVATFRVRGEPVFRDSPPGFTDVLEAGNFPLVPYVNRVRDGRFVFRGREVRLSPNLPPQRHPLHGQGWRLPWTVERAKEDRAELSLRYEPGEWPWAWEARQQFVLDAGGLTHGLEVRNLSDEVMPAGLGLHPYFPADAETVLSTGVEQVLEVDHEIMPTGLAPASGRYGLHERRIEGAGLDNGYEGWSGEAEIRWPNRGLRVRIRAGEEARRFQVYAPESGGVVVAEPVTHANDAFSHPESEWAALGLRLLQPGERFAMSARFDVESLA